MKCALLVLALTVLSCSAHNVVVPKEMLEAVVNDYVDKIFENLPAFVVKADLDPLQVVDIVQDLELDTILGKLKGHLNVTDIWTHGLAFIKRNGDAVLRYEGNILNVRINLITDNLDIKGAYSLELLNFIKNDGGMEGTLKELELYVDIAIDLKKFEVSLQDFSTPHSGKIDINLTGTPLLDWLLNIILDLANALLHETVVKVVGVEVEYVIRKTIDLLNNQQFDALRQYVAV